MVRQFGFATLIIGLLTTAPALSDTIVGHVTTQSEIGQETISGPVRMTAKGPQVQLPGGTWIYCRKSCSETLRLETVDFWDSEASGNRNAITQGPGLFGKLTFGW